MSRVCIVSSVKKVGEEGCYARAARTGAKIATALGDDGNAKARRSERTGDEEKRWEVGVHGSLVKADDGWLAV